MFKYLKSSDQVKLTGQELEKEIERLLDKEDIPYDFVECISEDDEDEICVIAVTYGDWRNHNERAHELIIDEFNPSDDYEEEMDVDFSRYGLSEGSDSSVVKHTFIWD